ncbi:hypothetical protein [Trinickia terrae]|nr:hypothetical protein [Trinickia terrae]
MRAADLAPARGAAAAAVMLMVIVVVTLLDLASAWLRERVI